jgi:hypothetical protein
VDVPKPKELESILVRCLWVSMKARNSNFAGRDFPLASFGIFLMADSIRSGLCGVERAARADLARAEGVADGF